MRRIKVILVGMLVFSVAACTNPATQPTEDSVTIPPASEVFDGTEDTGNGIVVLGELLEGYLPSVDGFDGVILLPLFPIAEKLGITTAWDEEEQRARVGEDISIWVGADHYVKGEGDPVTFGPAPQMIDGILYVPIYFFEFLVGGYKARIEDGAVIIERTAV